MTFNIHPKTKLPVFIDTQEDIFRKIANELSLKLPEDIEILIYRLMTVNSDADTSDKLNKNFMLIMNTQQYIYKYSLEFIDEAVKNPKYKDYGSDSKNPVENYSFIENYDEHELLSYAKFIKKDAILVATVTIMDETKKGIWDNKTKKFTEKKVGLIQGNVFYSESGESLVRFFYYFIVD